MKKYFNKTIFKLIFVFGIIAVVAFGVTRAFFSDTETSKDNVLQAGKLDLQIDNTSYYNGAPSPETSWELNDLTDQLFFNFLDLKPGDWGEDTISIHIDNNEAWACMDITLTATDDNGLTEPEGEDGDLTSGAGEGELQNEIHFVWWKDDGDNVLEIDEEWFEQSSLADLADFKVALADSTGSGVLSAGPLDPEEVYYIGKAWCFGEFAVNPVPQDGDAHTNNPTVDPGITCSGASTSNMTQTDSVMGDI